MLRILAAKVSAAVVLPILVLALLVSSGRGAAATTYVSRNVIQEVSQFDMTSDSFTTAQATDAVSFVATPIGVQIGGTATSVSAVLERSATDPSVSPSWATVDTYSGSAAAVGLKAYQEAGIGWWRVRVTAVSGGTVTIAMTGRRG